MLADLQVVAANLTAQTEFALPSDRTLVTRPASPVKHSPARRRRFPVLAAGLGIPILIASILAIWQPWHDSPTTPKGTAGPGAAEPIKVGVLHSLSGPMSNSETVVVDATLFAIEEIN